MSLVQIAIASGQISCHGESRAHELEPSQESKQRATLSSTFSRWLQSDKEATVQLTFPEQSRRGCPSPFPVIRSAIRAIQTTIPWNIPDLAESGERVVPPPDMAE
ncbi:hypothetical protein AGOR_G00248720 [Albula goreensis]|uniref:Uncharacterized protein n=1 Tax=Albula goreensis TaxID=1534307 RepID=A0A8T3CEE5_9TELE|nr:hypothetical protein AGOR_G00248720 [Albula goreensis]